MQVPFSFNGKPALAYSFQVGGMEMVATNLDTHTEVTLNGKLGNILPYCSLDQFTFQLAELAKREPSLRIEVTPTTRWVDELVR